MNDRFERGWAKLKEIDGKQGEHVIESLKDISPDFAKLLIEFPFGDVYSRPGLDLKSREIAVVAALTAMGNAAPQLKVHIHGALNVGCTREEIIEIIIQIKSSSSDLAEQSAGKKYAFAQTLTLLSSIFIQFIYK